MPATDNILSRNIITSNAQHIVYVGLQHRGRGGKGVSEQTLDYA